LSQQKHSRLDLYVKVLKALGEIDSLNLKAIQSKIDVDRTSLSKAISFLEQQNLVVPKNASKNTLYKNTSRGIRVFKYLAEGTRVSDSEISQRVSLIRL
jgi:hypothetical protein